MTKIIDVVTFNGDPIVELRLKYLYDVVDEFVIVEARRTFSGLEKHFLYRDKMDNVFAPYADKIRWMIVDEFPSRPDTWPIQSYMTPGSYDAWWCEEWQRNLPMTYLKEQASCGKLVAFICDVDEIPSKDAIQMALDRPEVFNDPVYLKMDFYYYNFQWKKPYPWYHAFAISGEAFTQDINLTFTRVGRVKDRYIFSGGWHCSYFLSVADLRRKLESFPHRELDTPAINNEAHLRRCLDSGIDIGDRGGVENLVRCDALQECIGLQAEDFHKLLVASQQ